MSDNPADIAAEWIAKTSLPEGQRWSRLDEAPYHDPELTWRGVLGVLQHELTAEQFALLAAGPLETLLSRYGCDYIERVEREAAQNPKFNYLLGGVWRCTAPQEVWERVQAVRKETW
jgi:hypothetical protein